MGIYWTKRIRLDACWTRPGTLQYRSEALALVSALGRHKNLSGRTPESEDMRMFSYRLSGHLQSLIKSGTVN
jgi:hypothetical protein